jgi:LysR family transcriptional activator of nhaA
MRTLNFNHLYYFWVVARAGSITAASRQLHLTQPTLSTQIKQLERALGAPLFSRTGRELVLTGVGQSVLRRADEMFRVAEGLMEDLGDGAQPQKLLVGASDVIPKLIVRDVLAPLRELSPPVTFECREWRLDQLLGELALERMDLLITDNPVPSLHERRTVSVQVGESPLGFFACGRLAPGLREGFPRSLHGAPMILPTRGTAMRETLENWFRTSSIEPVIAAEVDDRALMHYLTEAGYGASPGAEILAPQLQRQFGTELIGRAEGARDAYYVVTLEHRLKHRGVAAILDRAREALGAGRTGV